MDKQYNVSFERIFNELNTKLESMDLVREELLRLDRQTTRKSGIAISFLQKTEIEKAEAIGEELKELIVNINLNIAKYPFFKGWGGIETSFQEFTEYSILLAIIKKQTIPTPEELNVPEIYYLTGLADICGEVRRLLLSALIKKDFNKANYYLETIEETYTNLLGLNFSKGLVPQLRRKIDVGRSILEKSKADYLSSIQAESINSHFSQKTM
jgi:translin